MAHLWVEDPLVDCGAPEWVVQRLDDAGAVPLSGRGGAALLLRSRTPDGEAWLLMSVSRTGVAINGIPLHTGVHVLADRDEIRVAGLGRMFFATERLARVEMYAGAVRRIDCPRCKQEVIPGVHTVVVCPACLRVFHSSLELPCWGYAETCLCPQPTALDVGYRWTPCEL